MESNCPCELVDPCSTDCPCRNSISSFICRRCMRYGSPEQRKAMAARLAFFVDSGEMLERMSTTSQAPPWPYWPPGIPDDAKQKEPT